jgi:hypothetical protein
LRVYTLADMFQMGQLKEQALQKFQSKLEQLWVSNTFIDCVREVYGTTNSSDQKIRDTVVKIAVEHIDELWKRQQFHSLVREAGDFAVDIIGEFLETNGK